MKARIFKTKEQKEKYLQRWGRRLKTKGMSTNAIWNRFKEKGVTIGYRKVKSLVEDN